VLGAVSVASACLVAGSVANGLARVGTARDQRLSVEHPGGEFSVLLQRDDRLQLTGAGLLRTARLIFAGEVMIPASVWPLSSSQETL
jgi:4-oxalomesaconate tautomerase